MTDVYLTTGEVSALVRLSPRTLRNLRHSGGGPKAIKLGDKRCSRVLYSRAAVLAWMQSRTETRTHERAS